MKNVRHAYEPEQLTLKAGSLYTVHGRVHRLLASVAQTVLISDVASHHFFLIQHPDGRIGPPSIDQFDELIASGAVAPLTDEPIDKVGQARMDTELGMLEAAKVRNGSKSIWLFLNAVWTEDLRRQFGPFDDPATIRRWRTERRKAAKAAEAMVRSDAD